MNEENITSQGQDGDHAVASESSSPKETVSNVAPNGITLEEINAMLGKNYKDKDSALKSVKDTFSYVGKKIEAAKPMASESRDSSSDNSNSDVARQLREMKNELFYSKNSQYDTPEYRALITKMGENPADVVASPEFKSVFEKASGYDKIQKTKTVLESNSRIGMVRNKINEAKEAISKRDYSGAKDLAVSSVLEAYDLK